MFSCGSTLEPVWQQYIDLRGELFYLESEDSSGVPHLGNHTTDNGKKYSHTNGSAIPTENNHHPPTNRNLADLSERTASSDRNGYHYQNVVSKPKKQKEVLIMANPRNCQSVTNEDNGVTYCEKLFGIILCQYRPRVPNGGLEDYSRVKKDRKLIVQGVVTGSEAEKSQQIHRGKRRLMFGKLKEV